MTTWIWHQEELVEESVKALTNERWELSHAVYNVERDVVTLYRKWVWYMKIIPDVFEIYPSGDVQIFKEMFWDWHKAIQDLLFVWKICSPLIAYLLLLSSYICSSRSFVVPASPLLQDPPIPSPPPSFAQSWKNTRCKYTTEHSIRSCSSSVFGNICLTNGIGDPIFVCWNQILDRSKHSQVSNCQMQNQKWMPANGIHFWFCAIQNFRSYVPSSPPPCL